MKKSVFGKTLKNVRENRVIKLLLNRKKKNLVAVRTKLSYYKVLHRKFISHKNKKHRFL